MRSLFITALLFAFLAPGAQAQRSDPSPMSSLLGSPNSAPATTRPFTQGDPVGSADWILQATTRRSFVTLREIVGPPETPAQLLARDAVSGEWDPPEQLLARGVAAMRTGEWPKAAALLKLAYNKTPPEKLARPLILNRAIVDFVQGDDVTLAVEVEDVSAYLAAHPDDELAIGLLGALRNKAIEREPLFYNTTQCIDAGKCLESCLTALEAKRPTTHKGAQWMTAQQFAGIEKERKDALRELNPAFRAVLDDQADVDRADADLRNVDPQYSITGQRSSPYWANREIFTAQNRLDEAKVSLDESRAWMKWEIADFPKASWPRQFPPVPVDGKVLGPGLGDVLRGIRLRRTRQATHGYSQDPAARSPATRRAGTETDSGKGG
jgi:hypothetical protein